MHWEKTFVESEGEQTQVYLSLDENRRAEAMRLFGKRAQHQLQTSLGDEKKVFWDREVGVLSADLTTIASVQVVPIGQALSSVDGCCL